MIKGPDATAGSIFILRKNMGTADPIKLHKVIDPSSATETIPEAFKASK